jgi:hypothetical protein
MTEAPTLTREPEGLRTRRIWLVGAAIVAISLALTGVAWLEVEVPVRSPAASSSSPLEHGLIEHATGGADSRAAAALELERYGWVDRTAGVARIPIDRAIDAVVANPALISGAAP